MAIEKVIVKNYRALREAEINFGAGVNIVVGDNEAGKSTLLEAINLALRCQLNRRPAAYELHPFMFNRDVVKEFIQSHKDKTFLPPPSILIELYFRENEAVAEFEGVNNSLAVDKACGISFEVKLDEENFAEEYAAYVADVDALKDIPIEYYKIEWRSFAWGQTLSSQAIPIKSVLIDPSGCDLLLMEEPENHLSHGNLGRLINHVANNCEGKQLIATTHSSYVLNKLGVERVIMFDGESGVTLDDLPDTTKSYFKRLPGHDTLRMILARKSVLVEGPSDELIVQKAYLQTYKKLPLQDGVEVISVGTSFKRFLDIAVRLNLDVSIVRDNDGASAAKIALFDDYAGHDNIKICIDTDDAARTLEPQLLKFNGLDKLNTMLGKTCATDDEILTHMTANKTDSALSLFEHADDIVVPDYIQNAIG